MPDKELLKQIKERLESEATRLEKDLLTFTEKNIHSADDYQATYPDFGDKEDENAGEVAAFGDRLSLERTLEKELRDIKEALKKIKDGSYGICRYCGQKISRERLLARPTSSACVECKKKFKGEI